MAVVPACKFVIVVSIGSGRDKSIGFANAGDISTCTCGDECDCFNRLRLFAVFLLSDSVWRYANES